MDEKTILHFLLQYNEAYQASTKPKHKFKRLKLEEEKYLESKKLKKKKRKLKDKNE